MPSAKVSRFRFIFPALFVSTLPLLFCGCVFTRDSVVPVTTDMPRGKERREITTPVKAHLKDGSVILFPQGLTLDEGVLRGAGERYDLARTQRTLVYTVPIDQIAVVEAYERAARPVPTTAGTLASVFFILIIVGLSAGGP